MLKALALVVVLCSGCSRDNERRIWCAEYERVSGLKTVMVRGFCYKYCPNGDTIGYDLACGGGQ